jgi:hypothetical protein
MRFLKKNEGVSIITGTGSAFAYFHSTEALGKSSLGLIPGSLSGQMRFLKEKRKEKKKGVSIITGTGFAFAYFHSTEALGKSSLGLIPGSLCGQMLSLNTRVYP